MIALTLCRDNVLAGVVIIHDTTHAPLLVGETPLSNVLFEKYTKGHRFFEVDSTRKRRERIIPPVDFDKFITLGTRYFKMASLRLGQKPCHKVDDIEIEGKTYKLRKI
jgi:hypothetical protein